VKRRKVKTFGGKLLKRPRNANEKKCRNYPEPGNIKLYFHSGNRRENAEKLCRCSRATGPPFYAPETWGSWDVSRKRRFIHGRPQRSDERTSEETEEDEQKRKVSKQKTAFDENVGGEKKVLKGRKWISSKK